MMNRVEVVKRYKAETVETCECCGRKIERIEVLETGNKVGSECSGLIEFPVYRLGRRITKRQASFMRSIGIQLEVA